ncbi:cation:H+ antiporter [Thermotomaculum hydrothermale]|uniref:Cation:H+ antiporter n=1 Tax=Thermotomaculum hydrothermale TaxID=981385 RepID=A0A7R6PZN9_9BACT|nr:sodium:calcium antiporter [Thermotomaculum hydrothermale]BBB32743.1 cation:H+ antiporter [Thermotomaculum hydrothermale]
MAILLLKFLIISIIITFAGYKLTVSGDRIGDETGFGSNMVGFILLASITSLPELVTAISAAHLKSANLVFGNMIGSNIFNMVVIAIVVVLGSRKMHEAKSENIFNASMGLFIVALAGILTFLKLKISGVILGIFYIAIIYLSFKFENKHNKKEEKTSLKIKELWKEYLLFLFLSAIIVISGYYLTIICDKMATTPFNINSKTIVLGSTFVGQLFLAISTSLPELIVSISAVKIGKIDMAYANVFGSNIFNIFILGISSFFYPGNMFASVSPSILFSILIFFILVSITIGSLKYRIKSKFRIDAYLLILFYLLNLYYIFSK